MTVAKSLRRAALLVVLVSLGTMSIVGLPSAAGSATTGDAALLSTTPTPPEETPTPPEETPTLPEETPTPPEETPTRPQETPTPPDETPTPPDETPTPPGEGDVEVVEFECIENCDGVRTGDIRPVGTVASTEEGTIVNVRLVAGRSIDLAAIGATPRTQFRMRLRIDADGTFDPQTLVAIGSDAAFRSRSSGDPATVTVEFSPTPGAISRNIRARDPTEWPDRTVTATREADAAAIINVAEVGDGEYSELNDVVMATNAQLFTAPSYQPPSDGAPPALRLEVAAPHFLTDGSTVNTGQFRAFLPDSLLSAWGVSDPERLTVTGPAGEGTLSISETSGGVEIEFDGYHYSAGNVTVTADTAATETPTSTEATTRKTTTAGTPTATTVADTEADETTTATETTAPPTTAVGAPGVTVLSAILALALLAVLRRR